MVPEFEIEILREVIQNQFRIIYKIINENEVDVITIHYSAKEKLKL
jgi:hypothetical protein